MNIDLPASVQIPVGKSDAVYAVLEQDGQTVKLAVLNDDLPLGAVVQFGDELKGIVTEVTEGQAGAYLTNPVPVRYATKVELVQKPDPVVLKTADLGGVNVTVQVPAGFEAGSLGWSVYKDGLLAAVGNDSLAAGRCVLAPVTSWPAGQYLFIAQLFKDRQPIKQVSVSWEITEPLVVLTYGNYDDNTQPLVLE